MAIANTKTATLVLFIVVFVNLVGFGIVIPLLPFYGLHYDASPDTIALLLASYSAAQFVTAPVWGRASDKWGRKPILIVSLAGTLASYVWLAYAPDLAQLFGSRILAGIMAGSISGAFAYIADITDESNRSRGMGMIGAAFGLGFIAGPAIGGLLAGADPRNAELQLPALVAAAFSFVALILSATVLQESLPRETRERLARENMNANRVTLLDALRQPGVASILLLTFLAVFAFAGLEAVFALWTERTFGWGAQQNGYIFAFLGIISALIQGGLLGRLVRRFGETALVKQGLLALAVGLGILPFAEGLPLLLVALTIATYGFSVSTPALSTLLTLNIPQATMGGVVGIGRSASTLARAVGPAFAGIVFAAAGKDWPFFAAAAILLVVLALSGRPLSKGR